MEATGLSRRQQIPPPPPSSGEASPLDLAAPKDSACGGHADQARGSPLLTPPTVTGPGDTRAFRMGLLILACLSLPALAVVSGSYYRPSLKAFLSGIYGGAALPQQKQQDRPVDGQQLQFKSFMPPSSGPSFSGSLLPYGVNQAFGDGMANHTREILADDSSPSTSAGNSSDAELPDGAVATPSLISEGSDAKLHNGAAIASPPDSAGKLSEAALQNAAPAGPPPLSAAGATSEGADTLPSPGGGAQAKLIGGLLAAGFDEESCLSRYRSATYRRRMSPYNPSPYLVESLRRYEALHQRCGPHTDGYNKSLLQLKPGRSGATRPHCKYLVWTPENGLGNRMVSLASAFLYALLADRVLVIDRSKDLGSLFCEPFPGSTWLLPLDFPRKVSTTFNQKHPQSYGNMLRTYSNTRDAAGVAAGSSTTLPGALPSFVYAHLSHDYDSNDKRFFCERDQHLLEKVPWMVLRSDQYFAPALFLVPAFRGRLGRMFPEKEAVFHHLSRYLFHPSNEVWGLITDYYEAHLAGASERLGVQIRLRHMNGPPLELVVRQILNCTWTHKLLPDLVQRPLPAPTGNATSPSSKAVLLTSLHSGFLGRLMEVYGGRKTAGGAAVSFHQPSHEGRQQTGREEHDAKAMAEMYLLSMADELVTSVWSTFGYVAQGLGGLSPWILKGPVHTRVPEPACVRAVSMEPCFHCPPNYDCRTGDYADTRAMLPFTRKCRDRKGGLKLVGRGKRKI